MAGGHAKKTASANESTLRNLRTGFAAVSLLTVALRLLLRRPFGYRLIALHAATVIPTLLIFRYLVQIGTPRRDPANGQVLSAGEDLGASGMMEWCFDIIYVTWACQVLSAAFGERAWWLYATIPLYAVYKVYTLLSPLIFGSRSKSTIAEDDSGADALTSKRQQKLQKRQERGDPRVRAVPRK